MKLKLMMRTSFVISEERATRTNDAMMRDLSGNEGDGVLFAGWVFDDPGHCFKCI